ncbi:MAG: hypothetical protein F6J86_09815 [Symploca sp. SIO1B1]|nr:hypothetical protein [Symploca sp. SIO1C2]NER94120.1 hypothetical protein [Symploca sp. SIO1B1]
MYLIAAVSAVSSNNQSNLPDPDVTAYSFDRVVICQSDAIAQMLIANNFQNARPFNLSPLPNT